jgi:hypothetical protein
VKPIEVDEAKENVKIGCSTFFTIIRKIRILCLSLPLVLLEDIIGLLL